MLTTISLTSPPNSSHTHQLLTIPWHMDSLPPTTQSVILIKHIVTKPFSKYPSFGCFAVHYMRWIVAASDTKNVEGKRKLVWPLFHCYEWSLRTLRLWSIGISPLKTTMTHRWCRFVTRSSPTEWSFYRALFAEFISTLLFCHDPNFGRPKIWPVTPGQRFDPKGFSYSTLTVN